MTAEQWEAAYAARSGVTVEWLRSMGRVVRPCECGEPECEGWQSVNLIAYEMERRLRERRRRR